MTKSILLTWSSVCFCILNGFFNSALALDPPPKHNTSFNTYTLNADLKPIPEGAYQVAKATFLPDASESLFSGRTTAYDYNSQSNCDDKSRLYTTRNCSYPRAVLASSACPFLPGYLRLVFVRHRLLCIIRMTIVRNIVRVNVLLNLAHPTEMKQAVNMVPDILPMVAEVLVHIVKLVRRLLMKLDVNMEHTHALMVAAALELAAPLNLQTLVKV